MIFDITQHPLSQP